MSSVPDSDGLFLSLFDPGTEPGFDSTSAAPSAVGPEFDLEREWFVVIDELQIGPLNPSELKQRLAIGEIDLHSWVWKNGMGDWQALGDVVELHDVLPGPVVSSQSSTSSGGAIAPTVTVSAETYPVAWKPSAATSLASLVEWEMDAQDQPPAPEPEQKIEATRDATVPGLGTVDLFPPLPAHTAPQFAPAPPGTTFSALPAVAPGWEMPKARSSNRGPATSGIVHALLGIMGLAILALLGVLVFTLVRGPEWLAAYLPTPAAAMSVEAPPPLLVPPPADDPGSKSATSSKAAARPQTKSKTRPAKRRSLGAMPLTAPVRAELGVKDILEGVKSNAYSVRSCIDRAHQRRELPPGTYKLLLDWVVQPDGSVTNARMTGPRDVKGTTLPACFANAMRKWIFPRSLDGAPVKNFPFGPITIR